MAGPGARRRGLARPAGTAGHGAAAAHVVVLDYGAKDSIVRLLADAGARVTVVPHDATAADGRCDCDPTACCSPTAPATRRAWTSTSPRCARMLERGTGRCSASASGTSCSAARSGWRPSSCRFGHRGANHPVLEHATGPRARDQPEPRLRGALRRRTATAPTSGVTHVSLYDGTVEGLRAARAAPSGRCSSTPRPRPGRTTRATRWCGSSRSPPRTRGSTADAPARRPRTRSRVIGSGPIVIGQACEFDYSGVQALRVLREEGYETVLINSNPATIMTDPGWADRTYLEPLDLEGVARGARGASGPTRCCRRWAARRRSTWPWSCRARACWTSSASS